VVLWNHWNLDFEEKIVIRVRLCAGYCEEVSRDPSKIPVGFFFVLLAHRLSETIWQNY
jgi:hypothetical protein